MRPDFPARLEKAKNPPDIFELVKDAVRASTGRERTGLMLGLADLGNSPGGFLGAFYIVATNIIVINRVPLQRIMDTCPELYRPYMFYVLLHEYLHTLGMLDECEVRRKSHEIIKELFGEKHPTTQLAASPRKFIPNLSYPYMGWQPKISGIELVEGFDRSSTCYIG